jgi:hypothetical protein
MSRGRIVVAAVVVAALVVLFVILRPGGDTSEPGTSSRTFTTHPPVAPTAKRETIVVSRGRPVAGIDRFQARKGDRIVLTVRSDVTDEIHVHGYDLKAETASGAPARIEFRATIAGRFEIELENRGVQIGELTVRP